MKLGIYISCLIFIFNFACSNREVLLPEGDSCLEGYVYLENEPLRDFTFRIYFNYIEKEKIKLGYTRLTQTDENGHYRIPLRDGIYIYAGHSFEFVASEERKILTEYIPVFNAQKKINIKKNESYKLPPLVFKKPLKFLLPKENEQINTDTLKVQWEVDPQAEYYRLNINKQVFYKNTPTMVPLIIIERTNKNMEFLKTKELLLEINKINRKYKIKDNKFWVMVTSYNKQNEILRFSKGRSFNIIH